MGQAQNLSWMIFPEFWPYMIFALGKMYKWIISQMLLTWVLPLKVQCTSRKIYSKVGGTNMELLFASQWLSNPSSCSWMTALLTITLQGDSWANQDEALTLTGHSDSQIRDRARLVIPSAVPHVEEAQWTYQQRGSQTYTMFSSP